LSEDLNYINLKVVNDERFIKKRTIYIDKMKEAAKVYRIPYLAQNTEWDRTVEAIDKAGIQYNRAANLVDTEFRNKGGDPVGRTIPDGFNGTMVSIEAEVPGELDDLLSSLEFE
jgi:hypothetical protein